MRYLIDEQQVDEVTALTLYRTVVRWAAAHADRFVISLQQNIYDDPGIVARFSALGEVAPAPSSGARGSFAQRILANLFKRLPGSVQISGTPSEELTRALTEQAAPPRAVAGDLSPVEDILLISGDRSLYALYDYGRTQILDLDGRELTDLRETIQKAGIDPAVVVVAPPHVTGVP